MPWARGRQVEYLRELRRDLAALGICSRCRVANCAPDRKKCRPCLDEHTAYWARRSAKLKEAKKCVRCARDCKSRFIHCKACRRRLVNYNNPMCGCGEKRAKGKSACATCIVWFGAMNPRGGRPNTGPLLVAELLRESSLDSYELAEALSVSRRTVLRLVACLQVAGAVEREAVEGAHKAYFSLTKEARRIKEAALGVDQCPSVLSAIL